MAGQTDQEARLERLRLLAALLPLAYLATIVGFLLFSPFPSWATALVAVSVSIPFVVGFTVLVFSVVNTMRSELLTREERFRSLLEAAPDGMVIVDAQGVIVMVNQQAVRMFGYAVKELLGRPVEVLVPPEMGDGHVEDRAEYDRYPALRPMGAGIELVALCKDGTRMPVEISLSPIRQEEGLLVIAAVRDITARKRLEEERERLVSETEAQRERERIAMDLHDGVIQSIYAVALGLEASIQDVEAAPAAVQQRLEGSINELEEVIGDIRSYIFDLRPPRIDDDIVHSLDNLASEFRINSLLETSLTVAPGIPALDSPAVLAMYHIAREALNNVRRHALATAVAMSLGPCDGDVVLEVRDNGIGFDAGAETAERHRGLRNMSRRAAAAGGSLAIQSTPGAGTRVQVRLPVQSRRENEDDENPAGR